MAFPFVLGIKLLLSSFITNPAEMRSLLTKWASDFASSKVQKAAIPLLVQIIRPECL